MKRIDYIFLIIAIFVLIIFGEFIAKNIVEYSVEKKSINENLTIIKDKDNIIDNSEKIDYLINKYSDKYNVERSLSHSVALVESKKNQNAISKAGSIGIYQIQPRTAKHLGINPYDLENNIEGGIKYLSFLKYKFNNNLDLILAGYNAGPSNVMLYNGIPPFTETTKYIEKVKKEMNKIDNENN